MTSTSNHWNKQEFTALKILVNMYMTDNLLNNQRADWLLIYVHFSLLLTPEPVGVEHSLVKNAT